MGGLDFGLDCSGHFTLMEKRNSCNATSFCCFLKCKFLEIALVSRGWCELSLLRLLFVETFRGVMQVHEYLLKVVRVQ